MSEYGAINTIAEKYNLPVIEDSAQSFGATYKGRKSCNLSTIGSTASFRLNPQVVTETEEPFTNDDDLAEKFRWIRVHGQERKHHHPILGINGRMDTLQAAILLEILEVFQMKFKSVRIWAELIRKLISSRRSTTPMIGEHNTSVYAQYIILF